VKAGPLKLGKQPAPVADINEDELEVRKPKKEAAGVKAVMVALERAVAQAGVSRTAQSLLRIKPVVIREGESHTQRRGRFRVHGRKLLPGLLGH
jgi:hypothetical protein